MKKIGIIVEYNPLHNGHIYHLNNIVREKDDIIIACMSSSLVNRGEISVFTKFDRTKLALEIGVDIVVELPSIYSLQSALIFAQKSVDILNYIGVDEIWIGSESNPNYDIYYNTMNKKEYNDIVKSYLKKGLSFKASTSKAFKDLNLEELKSNDILGLFYFKEIKDRGYNITLNTIKRVYNNYLDTFNSGSIASATTIRLNQDNIEKQVPLCTYSLYKKKGFLDNNKIFPYLKYEILKNDDLDKIFLMDEGFDKALLDIYKYNDLNSFINHLNTKRYTNTRIKRILLSTLFNLKNIDNNSDIDYIRVLGFSSSGKAYINSIKKNINIYTNIKNNINEILDIEIKISKIIDTIYDTNLLKLEQTGPITK